MSSLISLYLSFLSLIPQGDFKNSQLKYPRVKNAFEESEKNIQEIFSAKKINYKQTKIFLRAFKQENLLELWAENSENKFVKIKEYSICNASGTLGPKRKEGDLQVPEGLYHIQVFNPTSAFHLSLGINYPNASDQILSDKKRPGGDIFIHGSCASIGCLAMTDDFIKEIYPICVLAKDAGQNLIPVHIFPFKMNTENWTKNIGEFPELVNFWTQIRVFYDYFETNKKIGKFSVDKKGNYSLIK